MPLSGFATVMWLVPPDLPWFLPYRDGVLAGPMIVWMGLSIPFSIVVAINWFRSPRSTGALRHLLRIPIALLAVTAIVIGVCVLCWVAYNLFWERQAAFQPPARSASSWS